MCCTCGCKGLADPVCGTGDQYQPPQEPVRQHAVVVETHVLQIRRSALRHYRYSLLLLLSVEVSIIFKSGMSFFFSIPSSSNLLAAGSTCRSSDPVALLN